jgi:hypothetical protein
MHPVEFRSEFGDQMISIFEEMTAECTNATGLCFDAMVSLARQWLVRSGMLWKALVSIALTGLTFAVPLRAPHMRPWSISPEPVSQATAEDLVKITLAVFGIISLILVATVSWSRAVSDKRRAAAHRQLRCARWR